MSYIKGYHAISGETSGGWSSDNTTAAIQTGGSILGRVFDAIGIGKSGGGGSYVPPPPGAPGGMPSWLIPAAIGGGVLLLVMMKRKKAA